MNPLKMVNLLKEGYQFYIRSHGEDSNYLSINIDIYKESYHFSMLLSPELFSDQDFLEKYIKETTERKIKEFQK